MQQLRTIDRKKGRGDIIIFGEKWAKNSGNDRAKGFPIDVDNELTKGVNILKFEMPDGRATKRGAYARWKSRQNKK